LRVCNTLKEILLQKGIKIITNFKVTNINQNIANSDDKAITFKHLINCAGMYADKIAQYCGIGEEYIMIPFKGLYLKYEGEQTLNTNIYPVPNLLNPFLGVHFTKTCTGDIKIGPTAIPAFWRENYKGFHRFNMKELLEIVRTETDMFIGNHNQFRNIAKQELKKYWKPHLIKEALKLAHFDKRPFKEIRPGIRAQLYNKKSKQLEMDFIIKQSGNTTHVLNAVSPAFTCAFALAKEIINKLNKIYT